MTTSEGGSIDVLSREINLLSDDNLFPDLAITKKDAEIRPAAQPISNYLLNLMHNMNASPFNDPIQGVPECPTTISARENIALEDVLSSLEHDATSSYFAVEFIFDELKLASKSTNRKLSIGPNHKDELSQNQGSDAISNLNIRSNSVPCEQHLDPHDIDLSCQHWLDSIDILTLAPDRAQTPHSSTLAIAKYVDCFQLPRLIESLAPAIIPVVEEANINTSTPQSEGLINKKAAANENLAWDQHRNHFSERKFDLLPEESFEVLFARIFFGEEPEDLYEVVLVLAEGQERHAEAMLDASMPNQIVVDSSQSRDANNYSTPMDKKDSSLDSSYSDLGISFSNDLAAKARDSLGNAKASVELGQFFDSPFEASDDLNATIGVAPTSSDDSGGVGIVKRRASLLEKSPLLESQGKVTKGDRGSLSSGSQIVGWRDHHQSEAIMLEIDPYHCGVIQTGCALSANIISAFSCDRAALSRGQQDSLLRILLRGGRRVEAADALTLWARSSSLYLLCIRVAASCNVLCGGFNIDASNESCFDPAYPSMKNLAYYRDGRGQNNFQRDFHRKLSYPLGDFVQNIHIADWTTTYGRRWAVDTSRLDEWNPSEWETSRKNGEAGMEHNSSLTGCDIEDFSCAQVRMIEAHVVFEKTLIYFLERDSDSSVEFLISLFDLRPLSLPIPSIASIYDKHAHISIKRAGIWEKMTAKI